MITELETIERIQSAGYSSGSSAYHFLQADVSRVELSDGSTVARLDDSLMGDPVSPDGSLDEFAKTLSAEKSGLSVFHIEQKTARALFQQGYSVFSFGVESRVSLPFSLGGKDKADLRRALNRSRNAGVMIREIDETEYGRYAETIALLNKDWFRRRRFFQREFRFLARPYVTRFQSHERRFVAFADGRPIGLAIYDPVFRDGAIVGYFEAIVRNYCDNVAGVRDHLTVTAMDVFSSEKSSINSKVEWVSLGLCPFAPWQEGAFEKDSLSLASLAMDGFFRYGNHIFNCRGLAFHKNRYRGEAVPIYFATKSRFPLLALYRACRLSYIDPFLALETSVELFLIRIRLEISRVFHTSPMVPHQ